jgi:hypothetical protein
MEVEPQEQSTKQTDHLKPWMFKPGVSGNPGGRPKGAKSLKTFAREYLESLSDEEKIEYMKGMNKDIIWEMAEGKAMTNADITTGGQPINIVITKYGDKPTV